MVRVLVLLLSALLSAPVRADETPARPRVECLGPGGVEDALRTGRARRLTEIGRTIDGDILRAELCRAVETLVWRVTVVDEGGRVRRILLDAGSGRLMYDAR